MIIFFFSASPSIVVMGSHLGMKVSGRERRVGQGGTSLICSPKMRIGNGSQRPLSAASVSMRLVLK